MSLLKLRDMFEEYKERKFKFIEPGGNYGDHLIYIGAKKLANSLGIEYKTSSYKARFESGDIIYIHGGGGFNDFYGARSPKILKRIRERYPKNLTIVGPTTSILNLNYLKGILPKDHENLIFFAREKNTYEFIRNNFYSKTYLDHDTSLHLSKDGEIFKSFTGNATIEEKYKLLVRRIDEERAEVPKDINVKDFDIVCDPSKMTKKEYINLHFKASKITTNRLHSAILGTILGKEVQMFANSYHKNRSVWEYSLKDKGVSWIGPHILGGATYARARVMVFCKRNLRRIWLFKEKICARVREK